MAYPTIVICSIVTLFKVGKDYKYIIQFLSKEFKIKVPKSTISRIINRHKDGKNDFRPYVR